MNVTVKRSLLPVTKYGLIQSRYASQFSKERDNVIFKKDFMKMKEDWCDKVNNLPTVEQRLVELNMKKLFKYKLPFFDGNTIPLNGLEFLKYATRTHVEQSLPQHFYSEDTYVDEICKDLEDEVKEAILVDTGQNENNMSQFFNNINMMLVRKLQKDIPHLKDAITDYNVRIEAFWFLGHTHLTESLKDYLRLKKQKPAGWYCNRPVRSHVRPNLVLRTKMPLGQATEIDSDLSRGQKIPFCKFLPEYYGFNLEEKRAVILPGYFPGVTNEHGHLFIHDMSSVEKFKEKYGDSYLGLAHQQRAILAGFSQAFSHAFFQGATPFRDPERPITHQTVFSDGKIWVFSVYQLNTCNFSLKRGFEYTHNNVLWLQQPMQMFDCIEDNKVMGYNPDILKTLVKMYMKEPVEVPESEEIRFLMDHHASQEFKDEFHFHFRLLMSEIKYFGKKELDPAMWEYIYKIWHQTRPMDAKRKWFEIPWRRTPNHLRQISDIYPRYIPPGIRAHKPIQRRPRLDTENLLKYDTVSLKRGINMEKYGKFLTTSDGMRKFLNQKGDRYLLRDY